MKPIPRSIFAIVLLLLSSNIFACLNLYVIDERGREGVFNTYPIHHIKLSPERDLESLRYYEKDIKEGKTSHRYISNYTVYLIKLGRNKEALSILKKLAKNYAGEYEILANLATAYELNGEPDSALKYMRESLRLNPHSHRDSEWFHLQFLESAILLRDKKANLETIRILNLDTTNKEFTGMQITGQLQERIPLTSAPNPMLSKVLEETGDYFRANLSIDWSAKLYAMAIGFSHNEPTANRLWRKLESTRARVVEISKKNNRAARKDEVRRQLLGANWRNYLQKDIDKWKAHRAHYENNLTILDL